MRKALVSIAIVFVLSALVITQSARAAGDYWVERAPIPVPLDIQGAASVSGQIYVFGQEGNGTPLTYVYNPTSNAWTSKAPMPTARASFGLVACNNKIYAIGGVTPYENSDAPKTAANEEYNPATDTWQTKASMPTNRSQVDAVTANGKIYVMGGRTSGEFSTVNLTEIYDPANDSWATGAPIPYPVVQAAAAAIDNKIYVMGGQDEFYNHNPNIAMNQIYDTSTNSWGIGQSLPIGLRLGSMCSNNWHICCQTGLCDRRIECQ